MANSYGNEISRQTAINAARARRVSRAGEKEVEIKWFIKQVSQTVSIAMRQRVRLATEFVRSKIVQNISRPVTKTVVRRTVEGRRVSRTLVSDRSKPGEFPKADTTQLMKTLFTDLRENGRNVWDGYIGTPLDYGLILELGMKREFLTRTLNEESSNVRAILTGPIK